MFLWCHVRHINPLNEHSERIKNIDKELASNFSYDGIEFPVEEKDFKKVEVQKIFVLMCLVMKMIWFFQLMFLIKNLKTL